VERSFVLAFESAAAAVAARDRILKSTLQPSAIDILNPAAGITIGNKKWLVAIRAGGNAAAVERYEREFAALGDGMTFEGSYQQTLWEHVSEFTPRFLATRPDGAVVRASCTLKELPAVMEAFEGPAIARAGSGVCYGFFEHSAAADAWVVRSARHTKMVIEFSPEVRPQASDLWPAPGNDLEIMRRVKNLFDPGNVLNRGRLYRRI
jgi:FAD/FMN-containing dehydrogenase